MMAPNIHQHCTADNDVLKMMALEVGVWCREKGWADDGRTFGDEIALLHSELSEALEAFRDHGINTRLVEGGGFPYTELVHVKEHDAYPQGCKPIGVPSELADVLVRLLDTCYRHNIDLFAEWRAKMSYNWERAYRHGGKAL